MYTNADQSKYIAIIFYVMCCFHFLRGDKRHYHPEQKENDPAEDKVPFIAKLMLTYGISYECYHELTQKNIYQGPTKYVDNCTTSCLVIPACILCRSRSIETAFLFLK